MTTVPSGPEIFGIAEASVTPGVPLIMINLVRFKEQAEYEAGSAEAPATGKEVYLNRYLPAFQRAVTALGDVGGRVVYQGSGHCTVIAPPEERWDLVLLVEYSSFEGFKKMATSTEYAEWAQPHRLAAVADWRLVLTTKDA